MKYQFFTKISIQHFFISALLNFILLVPFKYTLGLIQGVEVRVSAFLPIVVGLVWGPAAAAGIALGNVLGDIYSGYTGYVMITGAVSNFFFAYIPYKLWYSFKPGAKAEWLLHDVRNIIKFIYILFINALVTASMLAMVIESSEMGAAKGSFFLFFSNHFDFPLLIGLPLLLLLSNGRIRPHLPLPAKNQQKTAPYYDLLLYAVIVAGILYVLVPAYDMPALHPRAALACWLGMTAALALFTRKPTGYVKNERLEQIKLPSSIKLKVTFGVALISMIFIGFVGLIAHHASTRNLIEGQLQIWLSIYQHMIWSIYIVVGVMLIFLWYAEKKIILPLTQLTEMTDQFAASDHQDPESGTLRIEPLVIKTGDEIEILANSYQSMMRDINRYVIDLAQVTMERERAEAELNVAMRIQTSLLPSEEILRSQVSFAIHAAMYPAKEVGGDFYDFFMLDKAHLFICIADVSGKGVPAALFMVIAKTLIKNNAQLGYRPGKILELTNNQLCENNEAEMFVTAFIGILDIESGVFTYVNAGHNPPIYKKQGEKLQYLRGKSGIVLAALENMPYREYQMTLAADEYLFLYTDGITEALDREETLFTEARLAQTLEACDRENTAAGDLIAAVKNDVDTFADGARQADDMTMVVVKKLKAVRSEN